MPVPGGLGVVEAGLIAGLTSAGIPQDQAVAAVFIQRLFTAYLPPIWGWATLDLDAPPRIRISGPRLTRLRWPSGVLLLPFSSVAANRAARRRERRPPCDADLARPVTGR